MAGPDAGAQTDPTPYIHKLSESTRATYQARQLVVYLGKPQSAAIVEVRSTPAGTFLRAQSTGDTLRVWRDPWRGLATDDERALEDAGPPSVPLDPELLLSKYRVDVGAASWLLGVGVVPLTLVRREDRRTVERLWLQPETGVIYRRELFSASGDLIGLATMLDMRWGDVDAPESYEGDEPSPVKVERARGVPEHLPYGYRLQAAYRLDADGRQIVHWVYSDGLHALSVFRSPGSATPSEDASPIRLRGAVAWTGPGFGTWTWEGKRSAWTLVAEEPQLDPDLLTRPFPHGGRSIADRMGAWWAKAFRWLGDRF